jgi:hypothetical protein
MPHLVIAKQGEQGEIKTVRSAVATIVAKTSPFLIQLIPRFDSFRNSMELIYRGLTPSSPLNSQKSKSLRILLP